MTPDVTRTEPAHAGATPWREVRATALAAMTETEREAYQAAVEEEEMKLRLAQLVYDARQEAGISQAVLAQRAGTHQSVISAIENGAQVPTVPTLMRLARALNRRLRIGIDAA